MSAPETYTFFLKIQDFEYVLAVKFHKVVEEKSKCLIQSLAREVILVSRSALKLKSGRELEYVPPIKFSKIMSTSYRVQKSKTYQSITAKGGHINFVF